MAGWDMKNFSTQFNPNLQTQEHPLSESKQEQRKEEEKEKAEQDQQDQEQRARCDWDICLTTVVSSTAARAVSDTLSVLEFDPSNTLLATGGIARKIRIYSLNSLLQSSGEEGQNGAVLLDHCNACDYYICTPAKLSSLRWKPGSGCRVIGSGDYDGVVMEYDLERKVPVFERDEHGGRRVWSVDYSHWDPVLGASGSDDGTMQMWDPRCEGGKCMAMVRPSVGHSSVCCVEFNPFGGTLVAVGCADKRAYGYDVRKMVDPVLVFDGHQKTVAYVRFFDHQTIVTSSTDGCLKLWRTENQHLIRTYKGHVNARNFVGLSVWRSGGLLGCGSESNQVFVYDKRWGEPIWVHGFESVARAGCDRGFVSSVCWSQDGDDGCTLVAGGSDGVLQVFRGKRRSFS